jgi:methanogenic corrinoid protein MtbC1
VKVDVLMARPEPHTNEPLLAIGDVVAALHRDYPDVTRSSLRFLEREGLIEAERTAGGHRLYTRTDVDRLRQIKRWQAQRLSLQQIRQRLTQLDRLPEPETLAARFLALAIAGDRTAAQTLIMSADDVGLPLLRLFGDVVQPALYAVGRRWEDGELAVAQEKEISELARDLITEVVNRHLPAAPGGPAVVAGCVEGERHELGLRMLCGLLRTAGYQVHFLGADVAPRFLVEAVRLRRPDAVLLSVKIDSHLFAVREAVEALDTVPDEPAVRRIIVGGDAVAAKSAQIVEWGATPVAAAHLATVITEVKRLVPSPQPAASPQADLR